MTPLCGTRTGVKPTQFRRVVITAEGTKDVGPRGANARAKGLLPKVGGRQNTRMFLH